MQELVGQHGQAEHIGACIGLRAIQPLGRHVGRGSNHGPRLREVKLLGIAIHETRFPMQLGQAEIENLHQPVRTHHDVGRLHPPPVE